MSITFSIKNNSIQKLLECKLNTNQVHLFTEVLEVRQGSQDQLRNDLSSSEAHVRGT